MSSVPRISLPLVDGAMVTVPDDPALMTPFVLREQGDWFEDEIRFLRTYLLPGMAVVDVGANYGCYTLASARRVGAMGRVWAYEPASLPGECLAESIRPYPWISLHRLALSDHTGHALLGISQHAELNSLSTHEGETESVTLATIDAEMVGWDRAIDFLKLDAEGEEVRILAGAKAFFARGDHPLVMLELKHGGQVNHGLLQAAVDLGMQLYRLVPGLQVLEPCNPSLPMDDFQLNLFACDDIRRKEMQERGLLIDLPCAVPALDARAAWNVMAEWGAHHPWTGSLWPKGKPITHDQPLGGAYLTGMAHLLLSESPSLPIHDRYAHLMEASSRLSAAFHHAPTVSRGVTASRALLRRGARGHAVTILRSCIVAPGVGPQEAFLPVQPSHEDLDYAGCSVDAVLRIFLRDALLLWHGWSLFFSARHLAPLVEEASRNEIACPEVRHRLSLLARMR